MNAQTIDTIKQVTEELLAQLLIEGSAVVTAEEDSYTVVIETQDSGVLIGYRGRTLESLQTMLAQMVHTKLAEWLRITVSVGDYRERQAEKLQAMAQEAAAEVSQTGRPVTISDLSPYERRLIHMTLQDHPQVVSESEGEGRHRTLIIKPKM